MEENRIKAEIVTHSKRKSTGEEIITYKLTFPRIILSEVNTYKMLEKNTSSSRAIPFNKMVEVVKNDPFIPIAWQLPHSGMQGTEYYTDPEIIESKIKNWLEARDSAVKMAENLDIDKVEEKKKVCKDIRDIVEGDNYETIVTEHNNPISKQLKNRILEPFMWTTQLITGTKESFQHLFEQRCPKYEITEFNSKITGISKKSLIEFMQGEGNISNELKKKDELWWLQHNKGQAEIHFMDLAEKMYDALMDSKPFMITEKMVESPDNESDTLAWHIPFLDEIIEQFKKENYGKEPTLDEIIVMSVARTARISYTKLNDLENGNEHPDYWKSLKIYEKCKKEGHFSVFTHIAKCMADYEYDAWIKGKCLLIGFSEFDNETFIELPTGDKKGWNKNLKGFISLRQYIENGEEMKK